MRLIGEGGRPGVHRWTVLDRLPHRRRKAPFAHTATGRTHLDLGAMRRHCAPDGWPSAHLALFIPYRCDRGQGHLTMRTAGHRMGLDPIGMLRRHERLACMARLAAIELVARLPSTCSPLHCAIAVARRRLT